MSILGAIANPQMADIGGALDLRQQRLDRDESRRKEIRMGQLIAEALPNIRPDSPIYELAQNSPKEFALIAKTLGIPLNSGDQLQEFTDDVAQLYSLAQVDPAAALEHAHIMKEERNQSGRETPQIDKWLQAMADDPAAGMTGLFVMHRSLNEGRGGGKPAGQREFEAMTEGLSDEEVMQARRVKLGLSGRASGAGTQTFRMRGADGRERAYRFDPQTGALEAFDGQRWNMAGQADQRQYESGDAQMTPIGDQAQDSQPAAPAQDRSDLFVGRSPDEQAQLTAERTPEKGFRFNDEGRQVPIPGSAQERKLQGTRTAARQQLDRRLPGLLRDITKAIEEAPNAGPVAGNIAIPGENAGTTRRILASRSPAFKLQQHLDSIKSNISIDELQSMREASPTGGALGQVPVRQQEFLMQVQGPLLPTLDEETLVQNLSQVNNNYVQIYLSAIYGDEQEWEEAIADGRATPAQAEVALRDKEEMFERYRRETGFDQFGRRKQDDVAEPSLDELLRMY